ncbi:MAG: hypothetical protein JWL59_1606 [Chthoniobacteraceae bacterium]|nr:hypothetical protein [Chthoniobacteraceae bacterium]
MSKYISPLICVLFTWMLLVPTILTLHNIDPGTDLVGFIMIGLSVTLLLLFTRLGLRHERTPKWIRVLVWLPVVPFTLYALAQCFTKLDRSCLAYVALGILLPAIVAATIGYQLKNSKIQIIGELKNIAASVIPFATTILLTFGVTGIQAHLLQQKAKAKWMEIGHPMEEFKRQVTDTKENQAFKDLMENLKPFGITSLYKGEQYWLCSLYANERPRAEREPLRAEQHYSCLTTTDEVAGSPKPLFYTDAHQKELTDFYQKTLQNPEPAWGVNATDWVNLRVPNFLTLRFFYQLATADCQQRLSRNDLEGAAAGSAAVLLMNQNMRKQPLFVSLMINCTVEAGFARIVARLPEDRKAWDALAAKVETFRSQLIKTTQVEAYGIGTMTADQFSAGQTENRFRINAFDQLTHFYDRKIAQASYLYAEQVSILGSHHDYSQGDLGVERIEKAFSAESADYSYAMNLSRSNQRINCTLMLLEQAEMIRFARARLHEGVLQAEHSSVVIPGLKWIMAGDLETNSATLKLNRVPLWLASSEVTLADFFLLPFDGSKAWHFRK